MGNFGEQIGIGEVGAGGIAEIAHLPAIRKIAETRLAAVCDIDKGRAESAARKWGAEET
jgi:predicted dehydrogenase